MLLENNSIKANEKEIATIMNDYFINITKNLDLKSSKKCTAKDLNSIVSEFDDHISIKKIKEFFPGINVNDFEFETVTMEDVKKEILNLNTKKSSTSGSIPATILKQSLDIYLPYLTKSVNYAINESEFPAELKHSEVIPLFKKEDPLKKENYRPVSLLPHLSKVFERIIYKQINEYMENKLSKFITGFRKLHGTQHSTVTMLEKLKKVLDKKEYICVLFMDLSKASDTINHDLLLAKLHAYGFSINALILMCSYLKNRKQRVQINNNFSATKSVIAGVPQGSTDGPLLFNLFINDLVLFLTETMLSNYADDNNLFSIGRDLNKVKDTLAKDFGIVTNWFYENFTVLNSKKCHFMCIGKDGENETFTFKDVCYKSSKEEVILGITIDNKLSFDSHIRKMCKKSGQQLNALSRITTFLNKDQKSIIFNAMIKSQFSYCPIICPIIFTLNKVHERSLRLITNDENSSFETLLQNINDITVHQRNLQILMTEVYKIIKGEAPVS